MKLNKLKIDELLKLKKDIDAQIEHLDTLKKEIKVSKEKNCLSDLVKGDNIFCINFIGVRIFHMDYVKIEFTKVKELEDIEWLTFLSDHKTKPMGCFSSIRKECMSNHCFLHETISSMYFFTLKPEHWRDDLKKEMERLELFKTNNFDNEITLFRNNIQNLIGTNEVDNFLNVIL